MDGTSVRLAVAGLVSIAALCVVGMVTLSLFGRDGAIPAVATLGGTCLGILGTLLLPGRPNGSGTVYATTPVSPGLSPGPVPAPLPGNLPLQSRTDDQ